MLGGLGALKTYIGGTETCTSAVYLLLKSSRFLATCAVASAGLLATTEEGYSDRAVFTRRDQSERWVLSCVSSLCNTRLEMHKQSGTRARNHFVTNNSHHVSLTPSIQMYMRPQVPCPGHVQPFRALDDASRPWYSQNLFVFGIPLYSHQCNTSSRPVKFSYHCHAARLVLSHRHCPGLLVLRSMKYATRYNTA